LVEWYNEGAMGQTARVQRKIVVGEKHSPYDVAATSFLRDRAAL